MGEASSFCNRWACQHACKEGRERTVRVTEESNTKTDPSSRLASRIIMPRIITFRVIMPGIIILHGTLNLRQITICR